MPMIATTIISSTSVKPPLSLLLVPMTIGFLPLPSRNAEQLRCHRVERPASTYETSPSRGKRGDVGTFEPRTLALGARCGLTIFGPPPTPRDEMRGAAGHRSDACVSARRTISAVGVNTRSAGVLPEARHARSTIP